MPQARTAQPSRANEFQDLAELDPREDFGIRVALGERMAAPHALDLLLPPGARPDKKLLQRLKSRRPSTQPLVSKGAGAKVVEPAEPAESPKPARAARGSKPAEAEETAGAAKKLPNPWAKPNPWRDTNPWARIRTLPWTPVAQSEEILNPVLRKTPMTVAQQAQITHEFSKFEQDFFDTGDEMATQEEPAPEEPAGRGRWWQRLLRRG